MNSIELIQNKINRLTKDVIRYKDYMVADMSNTEDLNKIQGSLKSYSQDILSLIRTIEELEEIKNKLIKLEE